jgi:hypothetical protein
MWINIAIRVVVDDAARGSHDNDAQHKHNEYFLVGLTLAGDPQRPQGGPEQQPRSNWPIETGQLPVLLDPARKPV